MGMHSLDDPECGLNLSVRAANTAAYAFRQPLSMSYVYTPMSS